MSNHRCPKCGEEYSDTYHSCPFCEEEDAIKHGRPLRRRGGKRVEKRQASGGAGGVMLLLTGVIILGVVGYVFFGDKVADAVGIRDAQDPPASSQADKEKDKGPSPAPAVQPAQTRKRMPPVTNRCPTIRSPMSPAQRPSPRRSPRAP